MRPEVSEAQGVADLTPQARQHRIAVLKQIIENAQHIKTNLEAEKEWHLFRLSQIPAAMADAEEWMSKSIGELEQLEGRRVNNGYSISSQVLETTSISRP